MAVAQAGAERGGRLIAIIRHWRRLVAADRAVWMTAAGAMMLVLSALPSWSNHPSAAHSSVAKTGELLLVEDLFAIDLTLRLTVFLSGCLCLVLVGRSVRPRRWHLRMAWILPSLALAFPCWLAHVYPERMAERKLLYEQMNRVADDMDANLTEQQADWRVWQVFSRGAAGDIALVEEPLRIWQPASFSPAQAHDLLEELLGLSPEFLGFVRPTLLVALWGGMVLVLCGLHLAGDNRQSDLGRGLRFGVASAALFVALPLGPRIAGEYYLIQSEEASRRGDSAAALGHLSAARLWKPALGYSWSFYRRLGELTRLRDRPDSLAAMLADAHVRLTAKQPQEALERLRQARTLYPDERPVTPFVAVALAEAGIDAFNRGQTGLAKDYWEESLGYLPINPISWYGLSLVHHKRQQHDEAARCLDQLVRLQQYLGYKRLPVRSQALVTKSWAAFRRGELAAAHSLYSRASQPESW